MITISCQLLKLKCKLHANCNRTSRKYCKEINDSDRDFGDNHFRRGSKNTFPNYVLIIIDIVILYIVEETI